MSAWSELLKRAEGALLHTCDVPEDFFVPRFYSDSRDEHIREKTKLSSDACAAFYLAVAFRITHEDKFGIKAADILDQWASRNRGFSGPDGALVMCYNGTGLVFTAQILSGTSVWAPEPQMRFENWAKDVLEQASNIRESDNNWACWGVMAALACDVFLNDTRGFHSNVDRLKTIIDEQIEADGSMPEEISRGKRGIGTPISRWHRSPRPLKLLAIRAARICSIIVEVMEEVSSMPCLFSSIVD